MVMGPGLLVQVWICVPIEDLFITIMWTGEGLKSLVTIYRKGGGVLLLLHYCSDMSNLPSRIPIELLTRCYDWKDEITLYVSGYEASRQAFEIRESVTASAIRNESYFWQCITLWIKLIRVSTWDKCMMQKYSDVQLTLELIKKCVNAMSNERIW